MLYFATKKRTEGPPQFWVGQNQKRKTTKRDKLKSFLAETLAKQLVQKGRKDVTNMNCIRLIIYFVISFGICEAWNPKNSTKIDSPGSSELTCYVSFDQRFVSSTGNIVVWLKLFPINRDFVRLLYKFLPWECPDPWGHWGCYGIFRGHSILKKLKFMQKLCETTIENRREWLVPSKFWKLQARLYILKGYFETTFIIKNFSKCLQGLVSLFVFQTSY